MNKDLTVGKPSTVLWQFCLPLFGSIIFQQIYNIADSLVAGKFVGEDALAAVGNSYEITLIFIAFAFGCNIGCSVVVSQLFGARQYSEMKTAVRTAMLGSAVLCLVLMVAGIFGSGTLLTLIHTPDNIFYDSKLYLDIYVWGLPFVFFYNISTGIFSALGDSKTPFWFLAASSTANIFVDILFVKAFGMGVAGVAWATFLCQGISCLLALLFVLRRLQSTPTGEKGELFSFAMLKSIAVIAIPSIMQQSFISVGNILIQSVINGFGSSVMAGYSAAIKLNNLVITSFTTLGNGISNYTAQNLGAGKLLRIKEGFRAGMKMVWLLCIPLFLLYMSCGRTLVSFFMDEPSSQALRTGIEILRILSPFYFVISVKLVADGILRGTGRMKQFMVATFTDLVLRVLLAFLLPKTALGSLGIWCAWPIGWSIACVCSVTFYKKGEWAKKDNLITAQRSKQRFDSDGSSTYYARWTKVQAFSVTVPVAMPLAVDKNGGVHAAEDLAIRNESTGAVAVTGITVSTDNGWTLVPYSTNMAREKVDTYLIGFSLNGTETTDRGNREELSLSGDWTIPQDGSLPLGYDAVISALSQPVTDQTVISVVFVLAWA